MFPVDSPLFREKLERIGRADSTKSKEWYLRFIGQAYKYCNYSIGPFIRRMYKK